MLASCSQTSGLIAGDADLPGAVHRAETVGLSTPWSSPVRSRRVGARMRRSMDHALGVAEVSRVPSASPGLTNG